MLNVETLLPLETVSETVLLIELHTPAAPSTDHTMNTETTVTMPKAIDSRNDTFITDHGSIRLSRRRARRARTDAWRRSFAAAEIRRWSRSVRGIRAVSWVGSWVVSLVSGRVWTGACSAERS